MVINNKLVLCQVTFYVLTLVLCVCVFVPIAFNLYDFKYQISDRAGAAIASSVLVDFGLITKDKMQNVIDKGYCLLFTNGTWRETDGQFIADWSSQAFCNFNIGFGCFTLVLSLTQIHRFISYLCSESDATFLSAFVDVLVGIFMSLATLAGAIIITMGYQVWCDAIMQRFEQCEDASSNPIFKDEGIDTAMFYTQFGTAQFGAWCLWVCWVGLSVVALLKVCHYHQIENIRTSMARERTRIDSDARLIGRQ